MKTLLRTKAILAAVLLGLATLPAIAQEPACTPVEEVVAAGKGSYEHIAVTGDELAAYIDGYNVVAHGEQGKDDFDRIEIFMLDAKNIGWAFFKDGCLVGGGVVPRKLHDDIVSQMLRGRI